MTGAPKTVDALYRRFRNAMFVRVETDGPSRSAENWFLDAATFAHDGDPDHAVEAALAGIAAIRGIGNA